MAKLCPYTFPISSVLIFCADDWKREPTEMRLVEEGAVPTGQLRENSSTRGQGTHFLT